MPGLEVGFTTEASIEEGLPGIVGLYTFSPTLLNNLGTIWVFIPESFVFEVPFSSDYWFEGEVNGAVV